MKKWLQQGFLFIFLLSTTNPTTFLFKLNQVPCLYDFSIEKVLFGSRAKKFRNLTGSWALKNYVLLWFWMFRQCFGSRSARIRIHLAVLDPNSYWECGSGFRNLPYFTDRPGTVQKPFKNALHLRRYVFQHITYFKYIFHVKIQLFVTCFGSLDPDPDPHWDKKQDPDLHWNHYTEIRANFQIQGWD
jgi:hypothetical protein